MYEVGIKPTLDELLIEATTHQAIERLLSGDDSLIHLVLGDVDEKLFKSSALGSNPH